MITKIYEKVKNFILENLKFFIIVLLIFCLFKIELPFVVYTPGGIVPLEKRISIDGANKSSGSLNMSYVSLRKGNIPVVLLSYVIPNWDLFSKDEITNNDESVDELLKMEKLYMTSSINNATILAYQKANKSIKISKTINTVVYIDEKANTNIQKYDEILSVDGKEISNIDELKSIVKTHKKDDKINITVKRNKKVVSCYAKVLEIEDELKIGIAFLTTFEYETDPKIEIKTKTTESGSSGGLMLSLAIYNALVKEDITKGQKIVGTGTIDKNGNVGEIDGVKYKLLGAAKKKANLFICPESNYDEAIKVKEKYKLSIKIVSVKTFDEALEVLKNN